jgi:hypothetical protein
MRYRPITGPGAFAQRTKIAEKPSATMPVPNARYGRRVRRKGTGREFKSIFIRILRPIDVNVKKITRIFFVNFPDTGYNTAHRVQSDLPPRQNALGRELIQEDNR